MHVIAAKAMCFEEALKDDFKIYIEQVLKNSKKLAEVLKEKGLRVVSGGTDTHLSLIDLKNIGMTGKEAEEVLGKAGIVVNKNTIPFDEKPPTITSGIRIGSPCVTTRGMKEKEMEIIANWIYEILSSRDEKKIKGIKEEVLKLTSEFPIYREGFNYLKE